jgi:hypothetical protein
LSPAGKVQLSNAAALAVCTGVACKQLAIVMVFYNKEVVFAQHPCHRRLAVSKSRPYIRRITAEISLR